MSSFEDSDTEAGGALSPDSTTAGFNRFPTLSSDEEDVRPRFYKSRSNTRSPSRSRSRSRISSRSRSFSPKNATRNLFIESTDENEDDERPKDSQNADTEENEEKVSNPNSDDDDEVRRFDEDEDDNKISGENDFDLMMRQKKEENRSNRHR